MLFPNLLWTKMMADVVTRPKWVGRVVFTASIFLLLVSSLVPFGFDTAYLPTPDLLFALIFAVIFRRPDFAPFWMLAVVLFISDVVLMRPLGLWSALVLMAAAFCRPQEYRFRELPFPLEWGFVAFVFMAALLLNRMVLAITFVPQVPLSVTLLHFLTTMVAYPFVVFFCHFVLQVRKFTPDQASSLGHRL